MAENMEDFMVRNTNRLISVRENLRAAIAEIEEICAELKADSTCYVVLLGQIVPKIQALVANSHGKISISDILILLQDSDALE